VKYGKIRVLPIHSQVAEILKAVKNDSEYVFINKQKKPFNGDTLSSKFKDYVVDAGLPNELHFHSLRATFTSWLADQGASGDVRQHLLGHSDFRTTQGYATYNSESLRGVLEKIKLPDAIENEGEN
jgi:integrase